MKWIEMLEENLKYYQRYIDKYEAMRPTLELLDKAGIDATGGVLFWSTITISLADEETVKKIVPIKDAPVKKYFNKYDGQLGYETKIGEMSIKIVPDPKKFVCKIKKVETQVMEPAVDVKFELLGDCDPLFFEEAASEEVEE